MFFTFIRSSEQPLITSKASDSTITVNQLCLKIDCIHLGHSQIAMVSSTFTGHLALSCSVPKQIEIHQSHKPPNYPSPTNLLKPRCIIVHLSRIRKWISPHNVTPMILTSLRKLSPMLGLFNIIHAFHTKLHQFEELFNWGSNRLCSNFVLKCPHNFIDLLRIKVDISSSNRQAYPIKSCTY